MILRPNTTPETPWESRCPSIVAHTSGTASPKVLNEGKESHELPRYQLLTCLFGTILGYPTLIGWITRRKSGCSLSQ